VITDARDEQTVLSGVDMPQDSSAQSLFYMSRR